jgi:DNA topoisomerase-1
LGDDPVSGKPVVVRDGRFGPYDTDGEVNASLKREDTVDGITIERAADLLQARRDAGPSTRGRRGGAKKAAPAKKAATTKKAAGARKATKAAGTKKAARAAKAPAEET